MGSTPQGISASRVGAILGLSPYSTPVEMWLKLMEEREPGFCEKRNYNLPVFVGNSATRYGLGMEDAITKLIEIKYNTEIVDREKFFTKTINGLELTTHIDGRFKDHKVLNENKTTNEITKDNFSNCPNARFSPRLCRGIEQPIDSGYVAWISRAE